MRSDSTDAVRCAAMRALMREALRDPSPLTSLDASVGRLLLAGYNTDDICAALAVEPAAVHASLIRLAR